ncbi:MAG: Helix-turn-helix domain [Pseudomonadota bacterium]|jgi:excisionase family DNA binding protein
MEKLFLSATGKSVAPLFENRIVCEWLSSAQAACYLGISENALRIMVYRRQVKFSKLGRRLRFHITDLKSLFLKEGVAK